MTVPRSTARYRSTYGIMSTRKQVARLDSDDLHMELLIGIREESRYA